MRKKSIDMAWGQYAKAQTEATQATIKLNNTIVTVVKEGTIQNKLEQYATRFNYGRPRKVSFKRPSPQLSRNELARLKAAAILECVMED